MVKFFNCLVVSICNTLIPKLLPDEILGNSQGLFPINGGQAVFIRLVFAKNSPNGVNTDVPSEFYLRLWRRSD